MAKCDIIFEGAILEEEGPDMWTEGTLTKLREIDGVIEKVHL